MYVSPNFKSKAAIRRAIKAGETVTVYQPNDMFGNSPPQNGDVTIEGPHFPQPHKWYGTATLRAGLVVKVK